MKNNQGFTIVELVIVIAVVAILAAVMIPTFSGIIKKANLSADLQLVRNMNTILASEVNAPATVADAAAVLEANGIDKFDPTSELHAFYWFSTANRVILANESKVPVYPEEYLGERYNNATWFDLRYCGNADATTASPDEPDLPPPTEVTQYLVTYEVNNKDYLDLDQCIFTDTATKGEEFRFTIAPKNSNYLITKVLTVMSDGENKREFIYNRDYIDDKLEFILRNVTGDIEVSITVEEAPPAFVNVTFTCNKPEYLAEPLVNTTVSYGSTFNFNIPLAEGQYWITKLTVYQGGKQLKTDYLSAGESYSSQGIKMTDDLEINVHVVKYCTVTFKGEGIKTNHDLKVEWGVGALFEEGDLQKYFVPSGYEIVSATAQMGDRTLDVYDPVTKELHLKSIVENTTVTFVFKKK